MQKKQRSKEMTGQEAEVKQKEEIDTPTVSKKVRCIRECEMPGVGAFRGGEIIEDPAKIELIGDNPNFEKFEEEAKS